MPIGMGLDESVSLAPSHTNPRARKLPMCKFCVDEGRMTQADLDAMVAAGDRTVVPLIELTPDEFEAANVQMAQEAIDAGEDPLVAALLGALVLEEYNRNVSVRLN